MIDRILHITNKFSNPELTKEAVEKATVQYSEKGMKTAVHFLISERGMNPTDAGTLMKRIEVEYIKMNRELLAYKSVFLLLFLIILIFAINVQSPFFIVIAGILTLLRIITIIRFIKHNSITPDHSLQ